MEYDFLLDTYETERLKTLSVWSMFRDEDLSIRPHPLGNKDRNPLEHMVHQCMSENKWFCSMFGIDVGAPPLPEKETRIEFIKRYAEDSGKRLALLGEKDKAWWEREVSFFDTARSRAWVMVRRIAHTAHHRAEQTVLLRMWEEKSIVSMGRRRTPEVYLNTMRQPFTHTLTSILLSKVNQRVV